MISVCIVEDQGVILNTLKSIIEDADKVLLAGAFSNGEAFIREYENIQPDITLMDIDLPGISGIEAIMSVKSKYPAAKFLVLTVFNDDEKVFKAINAGAGGYILKKNSYDCLVANIEALYEGGAPMSPEIARKVIGFFQRGSNSSHLSMLTEKEKIVLQMIVDGLLYKEIADKTGVTIDAIKKHAHNIYEKMHVSTRSEAIKKFLS